MWESFKAFINTFINDTMKDKHGRWSRKSLTWAAAVFTMMFLVVRGVKTGNWAPEYIVQTLMALIFGMGAGSLYEKFMHGKAEIPK